MSSRLPISVKKWPSRERLGRQYSSSRYREVIAKVSSWLRVAASRITTNLRSTIAIILLHSDQIASYGAIPLHKVAAVGSHEDGSPRTTLGRGRVYCLYSSRTIEVWGDRESAEWYICGADRLMTLKNVIMKSE